ncbi:MAG: DUF3656 domain-containing protein [Eubacteriales bacterium]|nr:DUF3656 domain-containing protein [Eubacteriales bacterium]
MIELLAPAGSYEGFEGALGAGADAVYVGGSAFGARAYAQNFTEEELLLAIDTAHLHGKKLYMTVNTLLKNKELEETFYEYFRPYYERGLDAAIVQDFGVMEFLKTYFPKLPIHASTQMTVTGSEGMRFLEEKGVKRVVAARELSLAELSDMHRASSLEIEAFVHGALCYSYSGQCLLSSLLGGRSGNRGRCAQPCRLSYQVTRDKKRLLTDRNLCPLSPKDMCGLELLPEILQAGVTSLKIEGRMKKPEYTAGVVSVYRRYLDELAENPKKWSVREKDRKFLLDIFSRGGSCQGYFRQHNGPDMMAFSNEKKTAGVSVEIPKIKEKIYGKFILFSGHPAILEITHGRNRIQVQEGLVQKAENHPMTEERIRRQMEKCGNTPFQWEKLEIDMEEGIFVPVKLLNEIRREGFARIEETILAPFQRKALKAERTEQFSGKNMAKQALPLYASCENWEQFQILAELSEIQCIYAPLPVLERAYREKTTDMKRLYLSLPHIVRGKAPEGFWERAGALLDAGMGGFLASCLEAYAMLRHRGWQNRCVLDSSMYTWNDRAQNFWSKEGILRNTVPVELNEKELSHRDNSRSEMIVYGYLPLMVSAQCVQKNLDRCRRDSSVLWLSDRYKKRFPVQCCCSPWGLETPKGALCYNRLLNSLPLGLLKEREQVERLGPEGARLMFTLENGEEVRKLANEFVQVYKYGKNAGEYEFTKGHFKRGVE